MEGHRLSYKTEHEAFVSGNQGSTVFEIVLVCASYPTCVFLRHSLKQYQHIWLQFLLDYMTIVLPPLLSCTLLSSHLWPTMITMVLVGSVIKKNALEDLLKVLPKSGIPGFLKLISSLLNQSEIPLVRYIITQFRAFALVSTGIAILAVDFVVFPRRYCKTETYGTGLMDIGVGVFIFVNGISSAEARGKFALDSGSKSKYLLKSIKQAAPLLILGLLRVLTVKTADYHEHVSEYGVHWNFFFTLAVVQILSSLLFYIFPVRLSWLLSILVMSVYQYLLDHTSLREYILHGPHGSNSREGFLNANREGIFSSFGYLALYLASVSCGSLLALPRSNLPLSTKLLLFLLLDVIFWLILYFVSPDLIPVSRRMGNFSYVIWMLALNILGLCSTVATGFAYIIFHKVPASGVIPEHGVLLAAINMNGLFYFMLANIFTGLINLSMETIVASPVVAYCTLIGYLFVLSFIIMCLYVYKIKVKFW